MQSFPSCSVIYPISSFLRLKSLCLLRVAVYGQTLLDREKTNISDFYYVLCFSHAFKYLPSGLGSRDLSSHVQRVWLWWKCGDNNTLGHGKTHLDSERFQHLTARQPCEISSLFPPPICLFSLKLRYWDVFMNAQRYLYWHTAWQPLRKYLMFLQT